MEKEYSDKQEDLDKELYRIKEVYGPTDVMVHIVAVYVIYEALTNTKFVRKLTKALRGRIIKKEFTKPASFEDLTVATGGFAAIETSQAFLASETLEADSLGHHLVLDTSCEVIL